MLPGIRIIRVDKVVANTEVAEVLGDEIVRAAIQAILNQQMVTC